MNKEELSLKGRELTFDFQSPVEFMSKILTDYWKVGSAVSFLVGLFLLRCYVGFFELPVDVFFSTVTSVESLFVLFVFSVVIFGFLLWCLFLPSIYLLGVKARGGSRLLFVFI